MDYNPRTAGADRTGGQEASIDTSRFSTGIQAARHAARLLAGFLVAGALAGAASARETALPIAEDHVALPAGAPWRASETLVGTISYYAESFAGRPTASGEPFDPQALTMAHPTLPFGTLVRVSTSNGLRSVVLTVNDRGPFHGERIADVSPAAARLLGMIRKGLAKARLEVLETGLSPAAGSRPAPSRPAR